MAKNKGRYKNNETEAALPDQFVATAASLADQIEPHKKKILVVLVVALVGAAIWAFMDSKRRKDAQLASDLYAEAARLALAPVVPTQPTGPDAKVDLNDWFRRPAGADETRVLGFATHTERRQAVLATLDKLEKDAGGTDVAKSSRLLRAQTLYGLGRHDEAVKVYRDVLSSDPEPVIANAAKEGLAYAVEAQALAKTDAAQKAGLEEALGLFESMASGKEPSAEVLYHKGRVLAALGKKAEARTAWEQVLKNDSESQYRSLLEVRLAMLDMPMPPRAPPKAPAPAVAPAPAPAPGKAP